MVSLGLVLLLSVASARADDIHIAPTIPIATKAVLNLIIVVVSLYLQPQHICNAHAYSLNNPHRKRSISVQGFGFKVS